MSDANKYYEIVVARIDQLHRANSGPLSQAAIGVNMIRIDECSKLLDVISIDCTEPDGEGDTPQ